MDRPILMSGAMVRAILDGRKTQTRRIVKPQPGCVGNGSSGYTVFTRKGYISFRGDWIDAPDATGLPHIAMFGGPYRDGERRYGEWVLPLKYGAVGDRLWVRETWRTWERPEDMGDGIVYRADDAFRLIVDSREAADRWIDAHDNGKHADRWRPSIHMPRWASRITLEIVNVRVERLQSISTADAKAEGVDEFACAAGDGVACFADLWRSINGKPGTRWADNPWVWVVEFKRVEGAANAQV